MGTEKRNPTKWETLQRGVQRSTTHVVPLVNDDAFTCARKQRLTCQLPATTRKQWHTRTGKGSKNWPTSATPSRWQTAHRCTVSCMNKEATEHETVEERHRAVSEKLWSLRKHKIQRCIFCPCMNKRDIQVMDFVCIE